MKLLGQRLQVRPTTASDLAEVLAAESDPDNAPHIVLWSRSEHLRAIEDERWKHLTLKDRETHAFRGFVILNLGNPNSTSVELKRIVVADKHSGFGQEALGLIKDWVFGPLRCHRLWLYVKPRNDRARDSYERAGFLCEGRLRDVLATADGFEPLEIMSVLATEQTGQGGPEEDAATEGKASPAGQRFGSGEMSEPPLRVLRVIEDDHYDDVLDLYRSTFWGQDFERDHIERAVKATSVFVALENTASGRLVAMARAKEDGTRLRIFDVIVADGWRGQGVGRRLLDALLAQPEVRETEVLTLTCRPALEPFYASVGFRAGPINTLMTLETGRIPG